MALSGAGAVPLTLWLGPMMSGKTAGLIAAVSAARTARHAVTVVQHAIDTRSGPRTIASRTGLALPADVVVPCLDELGDAHLIRGAIIAVDEAQFFGESLIRLYARARAARLGGMLVAGLDFDFRRAPFGACLRLAQLATTGEGGAATTTVHRLTARCGCGSCAAPAPFTQRLQPPSSGSAGGSALDEVVLVGGAEAYAPACALHHRPAPLAAAEWAALCP
jgi:thymidine kinase